MDDVSKGSIPGMQLCRALPTYYLTTDSRNDRGVTTVSELEDLMKQSNLRMIGVARQAQITASMLKSTETVVDVVKAYRVLVDGKKLGHGSGSALVFLTNERLIVACGDSHTIPLGDIVSTTDLVKGKFSWATGDGRTWSFEHARGVIRSDGNQTNTARFYGRFEEQVGSCRE